MSIEHKVYILLRHGVIVGTAHSEMVLPRWKKDYGNVPSYEVHEVCFTLDAMKPEPKTPDGTLCAFEGKAGKCTYPPRPGVLTCMTHSKYERRMEQQRDSRSV